MKHWQRWLVRILSAVGLCMLASGCEVSYDEVLNLAEDDLHCPREKIRVVYRGELAFQNAERVDAVGCYQSAAYACTRSQSIFLSNSYSSCCSLALPSCYAAGYTDAERRPW